MRAARRARARDGLRCGRILLALQTGGIDAVGIDGSAEDAGELSCERRGGWRPLRACRMDARRLASASVSESCCPVTRSSPNERGRDAARLLEEASVLTSTGIVVVDAFVPRKITQPGTFTRRLCAAVWRERVIRRSA